MLPLQVVVYHGAKRTTQPAELAEADVVLTTYAIVEAEHRRYMMPGKVQCRYCRGKFYPDRLRLHLKCVICRLITRQLRRMVFGCPGAGLVKVESQMLAVSFGHVCTHCDRGYTAEGRNGPSVAATAALTIRLA